MARGRPELASPALIAQLLEQRRKHRSYREIAADLNRAGVPTLGGGREWYPGTVQKIVQRHESESKRATRAPQLAGQFGISPNLSAAIKASGLVQGSALANQMAALKASGALPSSAFADQMAALKASGALPSSALGEQMAAALKASGLVQGSALGQQMATALNASGLIQGSALGEQIAASFKASDFLQGHDLSAAIKASDVLKGHQLAAGVKTSSLLKGSKLTGISDSAWRSARIGESVLQQFHGGVDANRSAEWRGLLRDALAVRRDDLAGFMHGVAEESTASHELHVLSDWLQQEDAPADLLSGWLLWLSVPKQRRVFLASLWMFYALAMDLSARSNAELPANLATLIPFLLGIATVLGELLEPPDGR